MGPMIGAYCKNDSTAEYMWFAKPALLAMALSIADIIFVIVLFRETLPKVSSGIQIKCGRFYQMCFRIF